MDSFTPKNRLLFSVGILGFAALASQMLFMRGLVVEFYGNELSIGVLFAAWLLWTAAGSGLMPMILPVRARDWGRLRFVLFLLAVAIPLTDLGIRQSRTVLRAVAGEVVAVEWMLVAGLAVFALFCLLSGYAYAAACRMIPSGAGEKPASSALVLFKGAVGIYALETFGAAAGGLAAALFLFPRASQVQTMALLSAMVLISALILPSGYSIPRTQQPMTENRRPIGRRSSDLQSLDRKSLYYILSVLALTASFIVILAPRAQILLDRFFWKTGQLLVSKNTAYGSVAFARMDGQTSIYENGQLVSTCPDPMSAETSAHIPLLQHPSPNKILLIGGSLNGVIEQAFRHPSMKTVHAVELDPEIIRLAREFLPPADRAFLNDPRVKLHLADARKLIHQTAETYDAILLDMPGPHTLQLNRFYTLEFFREIRSRLNRGGIFSLRLPSSENTVGRQLSDLLSTVRATLSAVFPGTVLLPGHTCFFIASLDGGYLTSDARILAARIRERNLNTVYLREYYLKYDFSGERSAYLLSKLHPVAAERFNRDLRPIAAWYDMIYWTRKFSSEPRFLPDHKINAARTLGFVFILMSLIAILVFSVIRRLKNRRNRFGIKLCVAAAGFSGISLELIFLAVYQILCGVLYRDMAVIVAGFMAGLGLGSLVSMKRDPSSSPFKRLMRFQLLSFALPAVPAFSLLLFRDTSLWSRFSGLTLVLFTGLNLAAGFIAGTVFGLANRLLLSGSSPPENTAGGLYALDLAGSMAGVLLYTALAVPLLGIQASLWGISLINLAVLLILLLSNASAFAKRK